MKRSFVSSDGDETEDDEEGNEDDDDVKPSGARPRRISELKIPNKFKPIPPASSLFIFSPTNRLDSTIQTTFKLTN
jgi:hypothetical protein